MPASFEVSSSMGSYQVNVGSNLLVDSISSHDDVLVIVDERLAHVLPEEFKRVIYIKATEDNKSLEMATPIIIKMRDLGVNRHTHLLAIGGGIIQDIATFCASIYMRGLRWTYLPTTLLGMVDSCIGGKSSINVNGYKNLIGNFYPPSKIVIDLNFTTTLNADALIGGLCEAAKICYARSYDEFKAYLSDEPSLKMSESQVESIVTRSLRAKQWFIEVDEFDQKERLLLNFGHTFGHALEAGTEFRITHGIAVGLGMIVAEEYSRHHKLMSEMGLERASTLTQHVMSLLALIPTLDDELRNLDIDLILKKFESDKKHLPANYRIVVPHGNGDLTLRNVPRSESGNDAIRKSYLAAIERLCW